MALVGPGAQQEQSEDIRPKLEGATEFEYVTILNPLTDDFAIRVAQDVPVNMPINIRAKTGLVQSGDDVVRGYGLDLKNPDFQGRKHIVNDTIIKAGQTINLRGNEAQVAVRQLTHEILQRKGQSRLLADPNLRREVEDSIIVARGSVQDLMSSAVMTPTQQIDAAIKKSNEVTDEEPFPGIRNETSRTAEEDSDGEAGLVQQKRRSPGRPKNS